MAGARVRLLCDGHQQTRTITAGGSYLSASDPRLHFGLGTCARIEHLEIRWPDGARDDHYDLAADQVFDSGR